MGGTKLFRRLTISQWRQFAELEVIFHDQLTILTGANGAGKTSILNLLNKHFGWNASFISKPKRNKYKGTIEYLNDDWSYFLSLYNEFLTKSDEDKQDFLNDEHLDYRWLSSLHENEQRRQTNNSYNHIGSIEYTNGQTANLVVPNSVGSSYQIEVQNQQALKGMHVPSHRPTYSYKQVVSIPTQPKTKQEIYNSYWQLIYNTYFSSVYDIRPNYIIKETLIALATFGYGNEVVTPIDDALRTFEGFQDILRIVLPKKIGFKKFLIQMPEVLLVTESGNFSLDAVSGGIASIIDLAWQIFMYPNEGQNFVVTIDEPENHLHPEMQKTLLPNLLKAFPQAQFIVATHNPFIISSHPESNVYVLNYDENNRVYSTALDFVNKAGSSNDILRDVLGVSITFPDWVEEKLERIIQKYSSRDITQLDLRDLRAEMKEFGLDNLIPDTIVKVVQGGEIE